MTVDVLSEVLSTLALSARPWFRAELRGPFGVAVPEAAAGPDQTIRFHVATGGACTVTVGDGETVPLAAGDLVLVPHGASHVLADEPGRHATALPNLAPPLEGEVIGRFRHGERGDPTTLVCGEFRFGHPALHPFIASLPPILRRGADGAGGYAWVEALLGHVERETHLRPHGHASVVRRLSEILLIAALRPDGAGGASEPAKPLGALAALGDPQITRALQALHEAPHDRWSVERLARLAGQSRSSFVERFHERMGMPPMRYLTSWRMQRARALLAESDVPVGEIARRVGYASESAFNRSFREQFGTPPGVFRRSTRAA